MPEDVAPPLAGGRYRLVATLGVGGMATVYRVYDALLDVFRAVKVLDPELTRRRKTRERFLNEARTMAKLRHANIVSVFDMGVEDNRVFMLMELVEGGSLMERVEQYGPLSPRQAARVMIGVLNALDVSHSHGVIHRDVKPHNVLLSLESHPKVTDFGIATVNSEDHHLTRTGAVMGTWAYMAPEQRKDAKSVDARSDVYAAAATLYAITTGTEPLDLYVEETHAEMLAGIPEPLAKVVRRASRYRASKRYASAADMARALEDCLALLPADPPGTLPLIVSDSLSDYARPDSSDFDHSLVSEESGGPPYRKAETTTLDESTFDEASEDHFGLEQLQSQPRAELPRDFLDPQDPPESLDLPPAPPELFTSPAAAQEPAPKVRAPAPAGPRPATAEELKAAGISPKLRGALHQVRILPGGIRIDRSPLGTLLLATPRISHILLSFAGDRFRCNVAVPRDKQAPQGTTPLRSEAPRDLISGLNERRRVLPESARWSSVLGLIGLAAASLLWTVHTQLPADLLQAWGSPLLGLTLAAAGTGGLAVAALPLTLWSWWLGRKTLLMYDLDSRRLTHWKKLDDMFAVVAGAGVDWVVGGTAGLQSASTKQASLRLTRGEPGDLITNVQGWTAKADGATLTFMPDGVWIQRARQPLSLVLWGDVALDVAQTTPDDSGAQADGSVDLSLRGDDLNVVLRSRQPEPLNRLHGLLETLAHTSALPASGNALGAFL